MLPSTRSRIMASVRSTDTRPELLVRGMVRSMGYHYRLHAGALPGRPDLVFRGRRKIIFVHGCFWHLHAGCRNVRMPHARLDFWLPKLRANRERDERVAIRLREDGWAVLVIWECELVDPAAVRRKISAFLEGHGA